MATLPTICAMSWRVKVKPICFAVMSATAYIGRATVNG